MAIPMKKLSSLTVKLLETGNNKEVSTIKTLTLWYKK